MPSVGFVKRSRDIRHGRKCVRKNEIELAHRDVIWLNMALPFLDKLARTREDITKACVILAEDETEDTELVKILEVGPANVVY